MFERDGSMDAMRATLWQATFVRRLSIEGVILSLDGANRDGTDQDRSPTQLRSLCVLILIEVSFFRTKVHQSLETKCTKIISWAQ